MAKSLNASCNVLLELLQKNGRTSEEGCGECLVGRIFIGVFFKRGSDVFLLSRFLVLSYVLLILFSFVVRVGFLPLSWWFFFCSTVDIFILLLRVFMDLRYYSALSGVNVPVDIFFSLISPQLTSMVIWTTIDIFTGGVPKHASEMNGVRLTNTAQSLFMGTGCTHIP